MKKRLTIADKVLLFEKSVTYYVSPTLRKAIAALKTKEEVITYYLDTREWSGDRNLTRAVINFIITL